MTTSFELENNRLIKQLIQLLRVGEDALAKEIGVPKEELTSWKRGAEIPAHHKRKMQRLLQLAEQAKSFMSVIEKMRDGLEDGTLFDEPEGDILTEGEALLEQAINQLSVDDLEEFELWHSHKHYALNVIKTCFDHHVFSAYAAQQADSYIIYPEFLENFIMISNVYHDWVCDQKNIVSLGDMECETAHLIIDIIVNLTCSELIDNGYDSDYDDAVEIASFFRDTAKECIEILLWTIKDFGEDIDVNYYQMLLLSDELQELQMLDALDEEDFDDGDIDPSQKISKHFSLETKEILKSNSEMIETSHHVLSMAHNIISDQSLFLPALVNATQELLRIDRELKAAVNNESQTKIAVNARVLDSCVAVLTAKGYLVDINN